MANLPMINRENIEKTLKSKMLKRSKDFLIEEFEIDEIDIEIAINRLVAEKIENMSEQELMAKFLKF